MLRIALIIAILAGLGGLGLSVKVQEKIKTLNEEKASITTAKEESDKAAAAAKAAEKKAKEAADKATKEFTRLNESVQKLTTEADTQTKRANDLNTKLNKTTQEKTEAQQELSAWKALNIQPSQIQTLKEDLKKSNETVEVYAEEKKTLARKIKVLQTELSRYAGPDEKVVLPAGLKGKVLLVDQKNEFVVIDIGSEQGALERGEMLINRGGRLVAKVRLTSVQANRSIANVLPDFKQAEVAEGDIALR